MSGIVGTSHSKSKVIGRSQDTAKAWAHVSSGTVQNSFGLSSVKDVTEGQFYCHFLTPFADDTYSAVVSSRHANNTTTLVAGFDQRRTVATTAGYVAIMTGTESGGADNHDPCCVIVFGD